MKIISVRSQKANYKICVGKRLLSQTGKWIAPLAKPGAKMMIVSQKTLRPYLKTLTDSLKGRGFEVHLHMLPGGEAAKSEQQMFRLCHALLAKKFERKDIVVAVGGGVVSDLSGFAASVYLRGIRYVNIATTLLAQVDSAIGGKTGINLKEGKNLTGSFWPPALVISDVTVLKSLPSRELSASLGEVVKYGVIRDPKLFRFLEKKAAAILKKDLTALEVIVTASAKIKAGVVSRDEFETKGERMILNYGHTFGHGVEGALRYRGLVHGEAVAVGMVMAAELALDLGLCPLSLAVRQKELLRCLGLPTSIQRWGLKTSTILKIMMNDKKKTGGQLRFVLPRRIGEVTIQKGIPLHQIRKAIRLTGGQ